jgi:hypothetical protein
MEKVFSSNGRDEAGKYDIFLLRQSRLPYRACQVRLAIPYSHVRNNLTL